MTEKKEFLANLFGRQASSCCCCGVSAPDSLEKTGGQEQETSPATLDNQRTLDIEFLYLDLDACTRCRGTARNLEEALKEVAGVLEATGVEVNLKKIHVRTEEEALAWGLVDPL